MKKVLTKAGRYTALCMLLFLVLFSCEDNSETDAEGNWIKSVPLLGAPRSGAVQFTIENKVYVGLGYNPNSTNSEFVQDGYFRDFYVYDADLGYWSRIASFPGDLRERAVAFSINGIGYVGLGYNRKLESTAMSDFWQYDPQLDQWTKKSASFLGSARYNAVGFSINQKGYVGTGYDIAGNYNSDFYEYEPTTDTWTQLPSFPGDKRERAFSFVIHDKAYIGGGVNNGSNSTDFFEYNPATNAWTNLQIRDTDDAYYDEFIAAVYRYDAITFVLDDIAYIATGISSSTVSSTVYAFDPSDHSWTSMTPFEGAARSLAISFVVGGKAYVGTGQYNTSRYDDVWEFRPYEEYDETD